MEAVATVQAAVGDDADGADAEPPTAPTPPYVQAELTENEFVLSGVVPTDDVKEGLLEAARLAYSPYVQSDLLRVDRTLEPVVWLATSPQLITILPTVSDATMVISGGEVQISSGKAADAALVVQLEQSLASVSDLPVTVEAVEITNLREPLYTIEATGGTVTLSGTVPSELARERLFGGAVEIYGEGNVVDDIAVDDGVYGTLVMYKGSLLFSILELFTDYRLDLNGTGFTGTLSGGFNFETDSAEISPEYAEFLDFGVGSLLRNPTVRFALIGHTDSQGPDQYNLELSQRRADAVRDHYIEVGLDPSRLVAIGRGEAEPLASNDTAEGRRRNRRIDFIANPSDDLFEQE